MYSKKRLWVKYYWDTAWMFCSDFRTVNRGLLIPNLEFDANENEVANDNSDVSADLFVG